MAYKFLPHTADVKFKAEGKTIESLFKSSAEALFEAIKEKRKVKKNILKKFKVNSNSKEGLLYNFLEEFLYLLDAKGFLPSKIEYIKINEKDLSLSCAVLGDRASEYDFTNEVKAVTHSELKIAKKKDKYIAFVVLDV